ERYGVTIVGSEIVGLVPQAALNACSEFYMQIENFSNDVILERRLQAELSKIEPDFEYEGGADAQKPPPPQVLSKSDVKTNVASNVEENIEERIGTDGGLDACGAAAIAGSLASALGKLVCNLMISQKKSSEEEARGVLGQLDQLSEDLRDASVEESK